MRTMRRCFSASAESRPLWRRRLGCIIHSSFRSATLGNPLSGGFSLCRPEWRGLWLTSLAARLGRRFSTHSVVWARYCRKRYSLGARVVGADTNPWCVKATRENLEWLTREYELKDADFAVLQGDARKLSPKVRNVDCIATEPDLGPALRDVPTNAYAARIVAKLEPLFFGFLEDAFDVLNAGGRLVLVTPYFQTRSGQPVVTRFAEKAEQVGFKRVFPFKMEYFAKAGEAEVNLVGLSSLSRCRRKA